MDSGEATGFAHTLARLRGKQEAEAFLRSALASLETFSLPDEQIEAPNIPFELLETTLLTFVLPEAQLRAATSGTLAELGAFAEASEQNIKCLLAASAVSLRWRNAASRAAFQLSGQFITLMQCSKKHERWYEEKRIDKLLDTVLAMDSVISSNRRWFQKNGAGWEVRNRLDAPDERFMARLGEADIVTHIAETRWLPRSR